MSAAPSLSETVALDLAPTRTVVTARVQATPTRATVQANRAPATLPMTGSSSQALVQAGTAMALLGLVLAVAGRRRRAEV